MKSAQLKPFQVWFSLHPKVLSGGMEGSLQASSFTVDDLVAPAGKIA
jgi:hypothetical protein